MNFGDINDLRDKTTWIVSALKVWGIVSGAAGGVVGAFLMHLMKL